MRWKRLLYLDRIAQVCFEQCFVVKKVVWLVSQEVGWLPTLTRRNPEELGPRHVVEDQFRFAYPVDVPALAKKNMVLVLLSHQVQYLNCEIIRSYSLS
jgi:hypothetical protein